MSLSSALKYFKDIGRIFSLRRVHISLGAGTDAQEIYEWFSRPHAILPIFGNKTLGVELIDLHAFPTFDDYLNGINGKNSAAYYRRKALGKGYRFAEINRNHYVDDIYEINCSLEHRQGRKMHPAYFEKVAQYEDLRGWLYFGVINAEGRLLAYLDMQVLNEVSIVRRLLGHGQYLNDGIMYLLVIEATRRIYDMRSSRYVMYDMYFGLRNGLRLFKDKLGFRPYHIKWSLSDSALQPIST